MLKNKKRILFVGSHGATTGLSIIEEIKLQKLNVDIFWAGKKYAFEGKSTLSLEYKILPEFGVKFYELESGKIQTKFTRNTISALFKIPFGFIQALIILIKVKPNLTFSLGGASGALMSFWSYLLKIPVIVHEQTATAGRANIFSSHFAKVVAISRESSQKYYKNNTVITGNPIRKDVIIASKKPRNNKVTTIFFTGGSRGSSWINNAVLPILPKLTKEYEVIIQAGEGNTSVFPKNSKLTVYGQVTPSEMISLLAKSDMVVSRAGANTVSELILLKKPALLIPIYWSYLDEQNENAKYMKELGLAQILHQNELSPERLLTDIEKLVSKYPEIIKNTSNVISPDINATGKIVDLLKEYV